MSGSVPKKSLGQHWLEDTFSLEAICRAGKLEPGDQVVEVGPGQGSLTKRLLDKGAKVVAIEKDEQLAAQLPKLLEGWEFSLHTGDIMDFDLTNLPSGYKVIANIPYYLTSSLLRLLSESTNPPSVIALLVQKEVAERVASGPGGMSMLSVSTQMYYEVTLQEVVLAKLFIPPPKVDSQIVQLIRRPQPLFGDQDPRHVFRVMKAGFANRRKTLHNSLAGGLQISKDLAKEFLQKANIDPQARPQELSLDDWLRLSAQIKSGA